MSVSVKQPIGQKRLTNIAVVRLKRHGKRFEVACYKNKVISWRNRVEKDIDEVLQTHTVFSNVGKGTLAKSKDLKEAFGTDDEEVICREILDKGEFQVSDKERESQVSSQFRDIASIVMEKTINPDTQRPYTMGMVEKFIREVHFSIDPHKSSKQQALELIHKLQQRFPISRARMELRLTVPAGERDSTYTQLLDWKALIASEAEIGGHYSVVCQVDPGRYRQCDALVQECRGRLEVVSMSVQKEGDTAFDAFDQEHSELARPALGQARESSTGRGSVGSAAGSQRLGTEDVTDLAQAFTGSAGLSESARDSSGRPTSASAAGGGRDSTGVGGGGGGGVSAGIERGSTGASRPHRPNEVPDTAGTAGPVRGAATRAGTSGVGSTGREQKCNTCNAGFADSKAYREHFKSDWHKHNLRRKMKNLPPLSREECEADTEIASESNDLDEYSR